jgi:indolepyruvate ferredoxin oxidoreductase
VPWIGQAPFTNEKHIFANLGDGTYFHSGSLAVRAAVAANVPVTYKILFNDAVAMTGGQPTDGQITAPQITQQMHAEGVKKIVIVTDEPEKYEGVKGLPEGIAVQHRDTLDAVQREFREIKGTTVIIYEQTCATEKRRRRKRGTLVDPAKRVVINELVCEGCGDCGVQSNCLSVEPLETEFGRKRQINQSTCNKDYSCVKGFCPSFVTVEGGQLKKKGKGKGASPFELGALPDPVLPVLSQAWGIVVAGVGGTGVITIGQLLGVAAHLEGKGIVTQDAGGLAQKGGATWSHVLIGATQDDIRTTRVSMAAADLIIGCDPIVTAGKETVLRMREGRTHVALNAQGTPTAAFVKNANWQNPSDQCVADITRAVGDAGVGLFNADAVAAKLMGDTIYVNPMILGYAWQKGWIPLGRESLLRAIELNAVAVDNNKTAFEWGRQAAHDRVRVEALLSPGQIVEFKKRETVEGLVARRIEFLTAYQDAAYAAQYKAFVEKVRVTEARVFEGAPGKTTLTESVARYLFKLMAYKDEYEVARLHTDTVFLDKINGMFEGDFKLNYHMAPPLIAKKNLKGELIKQPFGPAMMTAFKLLTRLKGLRGGAFDIFGRTEERKTERALIGEYRASIEEVLKSLSPTNHATAVEIARIPEQIKGFGHVKERHLKAARQAWTGLMAAWRDPQGARQAA